jgi:hypothetical protein
MSGEGRYLLDTNAIVSLLGGNRLLSDKLDLASWIGISIVSYLEFLVLPSLLTVQVFIARRRAA